MNFDLKLPNQTINCSLYTLREHIQILLARNSYDSGLLKKAFNSILEKCAVLGLPKHEAELVLIHLIFKSNNQHTIKRDYVCECGHEMEIVLDIDKTFIDGLDVDMIFKLPGFNLKLKWPMLWDDDNTPLMIASCIDEIHVKSEQININELNATELHQLNESITEDVMYEMSKYLTAPKPTLAVPIKCESCGKHHINKIVGFKQFLELS